MYQRASLHGQTAPQHKFNSGKWVIKQLSILTGRALGKKKAKVDGGEEPSNSTTEADTQSDNGRCTLSSSILRSNQQFLSISIEITVIGCWGFDKQLLD